MDNLIGERWQLFLDTGIGESVTPAQLNTIKNIYYAGAFATVSAFLIEAMKAGHEETNIPPEFIIGLLKETAHHQPESKTH